MEGLQKRLANVLVVEAAAAAGTDEDDANANRSSS